MGRIRSIKPEFPKSQSIGRLSRDARLCFMMTWTEADDAGRLRGNPRMLASLLFPYDADAPKLIEGWLRELEEEGCIQRYVSGKDEYITICNWLEHQKIDHPKDSKLPEPPSREIANVREASRISAPDPRTIGSQDHRTIGPQDAPVGATTAKADFKSEFEAWWQAYPKKVSKGQGYRAYLTARKTTSAADLLAGVLRYVRDVAGTEAKFIRNPATWLNGQGWLDESVTDAAERERENFKREIEERLDAA